jgi:thiosulfate/3-mercaptopyruvate sulfurtransferase
MTVRASSQLVDTGWLEQHLDDPAVRIVDATVFLPNYFDESAGTRVEVVAGRTEYDAAHIPGSVFVDLTTELRGEGTGHMFPLPTEEQFAAVMSRIGIDADTFVVVYDRMVNIWATRLWWLLGAFDFHNAAVLDGGRAKWNAEGRPVTSEVPQPPARTFVARFRPELFATRDEVEAAIGAGGTCIVNALDADEYAGRGPVRYKRPGHIPTSVNVSFLDVLDPATNAFRPLDELRERFEDVSALDGRRVITYCGGGIAATADAFILTLLGAADVAVYNGSMTEWAADPSFPLTTGAQS